MYTAYRHKDNVGVIYVDKDNIKVQVVAALDLRTYEPEWDEDDGVLPDERVTTCKCFKLTGQGPNNYEAKKSLEGLIEVMLAKYLLQGVVEEELLRRNWVRQDPKNGPFVHMAEVIFNSRHYDTETDAYEGREARRDLALIMLDPTGSAYMGESPFIGINQ